MAYSDSLEKISSEVRNCILCGLSKTRRNAVPGEGTKQSKIMFIGEAPGSNEDELGRPFVGSAGNILRSCIVKMGLNPNDVYITNLVKCRPPRNRVPTFEEQEICNPYLQREISLIRPQIICILGAVAYSMILNGKSILKNRGKIIHKDNNTFFITIHPAATLYNSKLKDLFEQDMKLLSELVK